MAGSDIAVKFNDLRIVPIGYICLSLVAEGERLIEGLHRDHHQSGIQLPTTEDTAGRYLVPDYLRLDR